LNYQVEWLPDAEMELEDLWANTTRPEELIAACDAIEYRLSFDPVHEGESRPNNTRITFEAPLAVVYRVDVSKKMVYVGQVWEYQ
jgi:hypothetical protein